MTIRWQAIRTCDACGHHERTAASGSHAGINAATDGWAEISIDYHEDGKPAWHEYHLCRGCTGTILLAAIHEPEQP